MTHIESIVAVQPFAPPEPRSELGPAIVVVLTAAFIVYVLVGSTLGILAWVKRRDVK